MPRPAAAISACLLALFLAVVPSANAASSADKSLTKVLAKAMSAAGGSSGAYVLDSSDQRVLYRIRPETPRVLASNTKLFTTSAALDDLGADTTFQTAVLGDGVKEEDGTWAGNLYLKGGGDPTFGSSTFVKKAYGGGRATVQQLALQLDRAGITAVTGRVFGDASLFDALRGGPDSGYGTSIWVGPLSGLSYNRGLASEKGSSFQTNPPLFAAGKLEAALEARGIDVGKSSRVGVTPADAVQLAAVESPSLGKLVSMTMKPSDNFFAEMLLKQLGGRPGSTKAGARASAAHAATFGATINQVDGSGLAVSNRASPHSVVRLLDSMQSEDTFKVFKAGLPIAGKDGTLNNRMRRGPARGKCRAKTGTITGVSTLSGYCSARNGDTIVFSILMNGVSTGGAHTLQDRMVEAIAGYDGR
jgi:D-alanyl-D-alanine carboxypeptidase/D-alanyl-D-alanine-endopeptidase (penicillin-binding protein 4)